MICTPVCRAETHKAELEVREFRRAKGYGHIDDEQS